MFQQKRKEQIKDYEKQEKRLREMKANGKSSRDAVSLACNSKLVLVGGVSLLISWIYEVATESCIVDLICLLALKILGLLSSTPQWVFFYAFYAKW